MLNINQQISMNKDNWLDVIIFNVYIILNNYFRKTE